MSEAKPKRKSPCVWIERDAEGRPSCVHGPATARGLQGGKKRWTCTLGARATSDRERRRRGAPISKRCVWIERDETGRPRCEHGWAYSAGRAWSCPKKSLESALKHRQTGAYAEWQRAYGKEYRKRHVRIMVGGIEHRYPVRPEKKEELLQRITEYKAQQAAEREDFVHKHPLGRTH